MALLVRSGNAGIMIFIFHKPFCFLIALFRYDGVAVLQAFRFTCVPASRNKQFFHCHLVIIRKWKTFSVFPQIEETWVDELTRVTNLAAS